MLLGLIRACLLTGTYDNSWEREALGGRHEYGRRDDRGRDTSDNEYRIPKVIGGGGLALAIRGTRHMWHSPYVALALCCTRPVWHSPCVSHARDHTAR